MEKDKLTSLLKDNEKLYRIQADTYLDNWKEMSKSELCNKYLDENNPNIKNAYVSALICKCWTIITYNYISQPYIDVEEWYETMIEAILYILKSAPWRKEGNSLYGDPKGPEKALHRCLYSRKLNTFAKYTRNKRKVQKNILSTDKLKEEYNIEVKSTVKKDGNFNSDIELKELIKKIFKNNSNHGIILDVIFNNGDYIFDNTKAVYREIKLLDKKYIFNFSQYYDINISDVNNAVEILKQQLSLNYLNAVFIKFTQNKDILDFINLY